MMKENFDQREPEGSFYDTEYCLSLEYRVFSGAHGSRIRNILQAVGDVKGLNVLDVGAGGGAISELIREGGANVLAIDYSQPAIDFIKSRFPLLKARQLSAYSLDSLTPSSYDVVTLFDVIEHCSRQEEVLRNCARLLKSGGRLVISTDADKGPYAKGVLRRIFYWFEKISKEGIIYRGLKQAEQRRKKWKNYHESHVGEISSGYLKKLVQNTGLKIVEHRIYPVVGSPLRDLLLKFFPARFHGDHQCLVAIKDPGE